MGMVLQLTALAVLNGVCRPLPGSVRRGCRVGRSSTTLFGICTTPGATGRTIPRHSFGWCVSIYRMGWFQWREIL